jgi:hypothetical protein
MKQEYTIELLEEYENVNFYSIRLTGEELTEVEAFFEKFPIGSEYDEEIDVIISWMDKIAERGALERYFRPEGRYGDGVGVIPIDVGCLWQWRCERRSQMGGKRRTCTLCETADRHKPFHFLTDKGRHYRFG